MEVLAEMPLILQALICVLIFIGVLAFVCSPIIAMVIWELDRDRKEAR